MEQNNEEEQRSSVERFFIAVDMPEDVQDEIVRLQKELMGHNIMSGSYPKRNALHLTLKFLGPVPEQNIALIASRLRAITMPAVQACLGKISLFGPPRSPKVIYVNVESLWLVALFSAIEDALQDVCPRDERSFAAHLTLVRVKRTFDKQALLSWIEETHVQPLCFPVDHFALMQSVLNAAGPIHTVVERYQLIP